MKKRDRQAQIKALVEELAAARAENTTLREEMADLRRRLDALLELSAAQNENLSVLTDMMRRRVRGSAKPKKAEESGDDSDDDDNDDPPGGETAADATPKDEKPAPKPRRGRGRKKGDARKSSGRSELPQHLPASNERHEVCACEHCGGEGMKARNVVVGEKLDAVKAYVRRRRIVRETKVCDQCWESTTAPMPPMPCDRAKYTCAFLAWLVVQKFVLLVPLDRTRRVLASQGIHISEGSLCHLIERVSNQLGAIDGEHWKQLLAGTWMGVDATSIKVIVDGFDGCWMGFVDVFCRDELTVYQFSITKHGDELAKKLAKFQGTLVCDAESRHNDLKADPNKVLANCNAHPRRKFRDAEKEQPKLAVEAGKFMSQMYAVEALAKERGATRAELLELRQKQTRPIVDRFRAWLVKIETDLLLTDNFGTAVRYYLNHFTDLTRFVDDADLPIDNNRSERAFQSHAKLRLNALFAGSPEGAHRWATILGIVETATRLGLDVFAYLTWALERRGTWKKRFGMSAAELTPAAYKKALEDALEEARAVAA